MSEISFRPLDASDIEVRVQSATENGVSLLLYKDARCDMRILDEVVGADSWQCRYRECKGNLFCEVGIRGDDNQWVWKEDVGIPSNMESEKGEASDAFKRACFKWGIGRELYTAPFIFIRIGDCNIGRNKNGKPACYDRFSVASINTEDGCITDITIRNDSLGRIVWPKGADKARSGSSKISAYLKRVEQLQQKAVQVGIKPESLSEYVNAKYKKPLPELDCEQLEDVGKHLKQLIEDMEKINGSSNELAEG